MTNLINAYSSRDRVIHTYIIQQLRLCEALKLDNPYRLYPNQYTSIWAWLLKDVIGLQIALFAQTHPQPRMTCMGELLGASLLVKSTFQVDLK